MSFSAPGGRWQRGILSSIKLCDSSTLRRAENLWSDVIKYDLTAADIVQVREFIVGQLAQRRGKRARQKPFKFTEQSFSRKVSPPERAGLLLHRICMSGRAGAIFPFPRGSIALRYRPLLPPRERARWRSGCAQA